MPICNDNFNGCYTGPYYPRPIFNCCSGGSCGGGNNVQNPSRSAQWGMASVQNVAVEEGESTPIVLVGSEGTSVKQDNAGEIVLTAGNYLVSYSISASSQTNPIKFVLQVNGQDLPYSVAYATGNNEIQSFGNSFIISVSGNTVLSLMNQTNGNVAINNANVVLTKLLN